MTAPDPEQAPPLQGELTEEGDMLIRVRVRAHNLQAFQALVGASATKGISQERVATQLLNAGLVQWVQELLEDTPGPNDDAE